MKFYNVKTREHVDVPETQVKKTTIARKTQNGEQKRYALKAEYNGADLWKFVSQDTYNKTDVPTFEHKKKK